MMMWVDTAEVVEEEEEENATANFVLGATRSSRAGEYERTLSHKRSTIY